jgi:hypothetical protein
MSGDKPSAYKTILSKEDER